MSKDFIKLGFTDVDGVLRGKLIHRSKFEKSKDLGYCSVVFGWDLHDTLYSKDSVAGWKDGFSDGRARIDEDSHRIVPWDGTSFYLMDFREDPTFQNVCPRSLLQAAIKSLADRGFHIKIGFEYEFFNFIVPEDTSKSALEEATLTDGMYGYSLARIEQYNEIHQGYLEAMEELNIGLEGFHTETGPGVLEAAIRYDEPLNSADKAQLFKHFTKAYFLQHGIRSSFMAKWSENYPGCGCHIHLSMEDDFGDPVDLNPKIPNDGNHFLAGILDFLPELTSIYAPTINSYKRLIPGSWAPTRVAWGYENRTTPVRIIPEKSSPSRIEFRLPGTDVNPYLALYALISSGEFGMNNKLELNQTESIANAYERNDLTDLPRSLEQACRMTEEAKPNLEFLNGTFLAHFLMTRQEELKQFRAAVTDWELRRYHEIL